MQDHAETYDGAFLVTSTMARVRGPAMVAPSESAETLSRSLQDARVLIVDDCTLHRDNLAALIATNGVAEIGAAWDMDTLLAAVRETSFSILLLNVATANSAELLRAALGISPQIRVIVVGVSEDDEPE